MILRRIGAGAVVVLVAGTVSILVTAAPAAALTIPVTTTSDVTNPADGLTSLREAVVQANASAGADAIVLTNAPYNLTDCAAGALVHNGSGGDLAIHGNGASIHQTCDATRVIEHTTTGTLLALDAMHLVGGPNAAATTIQGAAIDAANKLVLTNVSITGINGGPGGSVVQFDFGPDAFDAELHGTSITGNTGAAVVNVSNSSGLLVDGSTLAGNTGGGIIIGDGTPLSITGTTIAYNGGFGVFTTGQGFGLQPVIDITNSSISANGRGGFTCRNGCRSLTVTGSQFLSNGTAAAAGQGGGLGFVTFQPAASTPTVTNTNTRIAGNHAQHDGGGLLVKAGLADGDADPVQISLVGSTVNDDHADCGGCRGGGVAALVGSVSLAYTALSDNTAADAGGGVFQLRGDSDSASATSTFAANYTAVSNNDAGGDGGGISTAGHTQTIVASRISGNTSAGIGGGLESYGVMPLSGASSVSIDRTTIDGNRAANGGGVSLAAGALTGVTNSTIVGNTATAAGGGIAVNVLAQLGLVHVTLVANGAPTAANLATSSPTTISRSIVALRSGGGANCAPYVGASLPLTSNGYSWFDDASCKPVATDTVAVGGDPLLGALADNGGPTPTRKPASSSPVNALVPTAACTTTVDQRNVTRPQGAGCEPGAVEIPSPK